MSSLVDQTEREKNREKPSTPVPFKAEELDETLLLSRPTKTPASSDRERLEREDIEPIPMESLEISDSKDEKDDNKQVIDPFKVESVGAIDYEKLIVQFGCTKLDWALVERIEKLTGKKPHRFLRRDIFFSHRDLNKICDYYEQGKKFYLYTGRGPSSESMHFGHLIPFQFTQWLQETFDCPLVIQLTDDEKFLFKDNLTLEECHRLAYENVKDIIACGFNPEKTFIFTDLDYIQHMYPTILKIQKATTYNQSSHIFGFGGSDNIGKAAFPAVQAAPSFPSSFHIPFKGNLDMPCLIPCAIDQDAYFRMTRDVAPKLKFHKPSLIHCKFFPPLQGMGGKMSGSLVNTAVYLTDTPKQIKDKINKHAFSGGRETKELQEEFGATLEVDVSVEWLRFFLEDDEELAQIRADYSSGKLLTGQVKKRLIEILQDMVKTHTEARDKVTPEVIQQYMAVRPLNF